jgi:hypothetical protein
MVQGIWGVVPIHSLELSPEHVLAFVIGTTYQIGNLVSAASSTIELTLGGRFPLEGLGPGGVARYDYGKVIGKSSIHQAEGSYISGGGLSIFVSCNARWTGADES